MNIFIWGTVLSVVILDQLTKFFIIQNLDPGKSIEVIRGIFHLTLVHNSGAAFGILKNETPLFIATSILAAIFIVIYIKKRTRPFFLRDAGLALILGGALGNLIDRLRFGYVIDFLDFKIWPVFNIADSAVTIGACLLLLSMLEKNLWKS